MWYLIQKTNKSQHEQIKLIQGFKQEADLDSGEDGANCRGKIIDTNEVKDAVETKLKDMFKNRMTGDSGINMI